MSNSDDATRVASPYFDIFHSMFEAIDTSSSFWQPLLKSVGRTQMEFAGYAARQGQAIVRWQRSIAANPTPMNMFAANALYWQTVTEEFAAFAPRVADAAAHVTRAVPNFEIVPLPQRRLHDRMEIQRAPVESEIEIPRRVA